MRAAETEFPSDSRRSARGAAARFAAAADGIAAVEFAMILPLLMVLYLGMNEVTNAVNTDHRVTLLARTLADLTGQQTKVTTTTAAAGETAMNTIFGAAFAVMAPYKVDDPTRPVSMTVSSVAVPTPTSGTPTQGTVCWSEKRTVANGALQTGTGLTKGSTVAIPVGFQQAGTSYVRADVTLAYKPIFGSSLLRWITGDGTSGITFVQQMPWPVRNAKEVTMAGIANCVP